MRKIMLLAGAIVGLFVGACGSEEKTGRLTPDEIKAIAKATAEIVREEYTLSCGIVQDRPGEQRCDFLRKSDVEGPIATAQAPVAPPESASEPAPVSEPTPDAVPAVAPEPDVVPLPDAVPVPPDAAPAVTSGPAADAAPPPPSKPAVEVVNSIYADTGGGATINVRVNDTAIPRVVGDIGWGAYRADKFLGFVRVSKLSDVGFDGWINGSRDELKVEGLEVRREPEPKFDDQIKAELFRVIPGSENAAINTVTLKVTTGQVKVGQTGFAYRDGVRKGSFRVIKVATKSAEIKLFHAPIGVIQKDKMSFRFIPMGQKQLDLPAVPGVLVTPKPGEIATKVYRVMPKEGDSGATLTTQLPENLKPEVGQIWQIRSVLESGKYEARGDAMVTSVADKSFTLDFVGAPSGLTSDMVAVYTPPPPPKPVATAFQATVFWVEQDPDSRDHMQVTAICLSLECQSTVKPGMSGKLFKGDKELGVVTVKGWVKNEDQANRIVLRVSKSLVPSKVKATDLIFKVDTAEAAQSALKAEADKLAAKTPASVKPAVHTAKPATAKPAARPKPRPPVAKNDFVQGSPALSQVGTKLTRAALRLGPSAPSSLDAIGRAQIIYTVDGQPGGGKIKLVTVKSGEAVFRIERPYGELAGKKVFIKMTYQSK